MKTVQLTDTRILSTLIETANIQTDGFHMPQAAWVVPDGGLKYATIKNLGVTITDGKTSVLLVSEISSTAENFKGIIGTIWELRGASYAGIVASQFSVTCAKAYTTIKADTNNGFKAGECTYKGKDYIGVSLGSGSQHSIFFSGFYTDNCIFLNVPGSEVTWK